LITETGRAGEKEQPVKNWNRCAPFVQAKMPLTTSP
jgi:hypothetical protein